MTGEQPEAGWRRFVMEANAATTGFPPAPLETTVAPTPLPGGFHTAPAFDVVELLPERAQDRLRKLRLRKDDAHAVIPMFEDIREANAAKVDAERALTRLTAHPSERGFNLPPTDPRVIAQQRTVDKLTDDWKRLTELREVRSAQFQAAGAALANVETWLRHGVPGGCTLQDHETEVPKPTKGENGLLDQIEVRRRRVRELRADEHRIRSAPYPSAHAKAQMRQQIEQLAERGTPSVSRLVELDGPLDFQTQRLTSEIQGERRQLGFTETADAVALICWLHRGAMIAKLDTEISTEADDGAALSHEARQKAEAEVMGDLLDIERQEAALVFAAWEHGLACEHRSDCSQLAILQVQLVSVPRAAPPPTSPEHGYNIVGGRR